jgi:hypothetical protein
VSGVKVRLETSIFPVRKMFRVHDATVDPDAPGSPLPPVGALVSTSREQLWVASLQEHSRVRLTIEEWDGAPPVFGGDWEDEAKAVLYLRGELSVDMGPAGRAVERLRLAGGVGDYVVRVHARNREEVVRRYDALFENGMDPLSDDFQQARRALDGVEEYLLQFWRES